MNVSTDVRVRRPKQHEPLMVELLKEAGFPTYRDILLLTAAVGFQQNRRAPFAEAAGDPIRFDVLTSPSFGDTLVNMIAANVVADPEVLDDARIDERVRIFEEYANGGLDYIQEQCTERNQPANLVIIDLVTQALSAGSGPEPATAEELLRGTPW